MNNRLFIAMCAITTLCVTPGYTDNTMPPMTQPAASQALADALYKIGVSTSDIGQLGISGVPPESLVKAFTKYANNSNDSKFDILTQSDRNALVFFGFKLQSKGAISDSAIKSLMVAEKMRTQMPKAQIKELMALVERIKNNPNYELTYEDVMTVDSTAPFINADPYAFSDVLGTLIGPILGATPESTPISPDTEEILINAARTLTGLTQEQMDNLQNIGDTYQDSQQFSSSPENVSDVNQVIETSYYPDSANLLLPFVGAGTLIAMSQIHYGYPNYFYGEGINEYDRTVVRNPNVVAYNRDGVYPRYNNNWANNRSQAWQNNSDNRSNARENGANDRSEARESGSANRSGARENGANDRSQTRDTRSDNRSGGSGGRR